MEPKVSKKGPENERRRKVRRDLVRRVTELAMNRGRSPNEPTREDVQQAKREVKPLKMPEQERI